MEVPGLNDQQKEACTLALDSIKAGNNFVLSGRAGTGKTTLAAIGIAENFRGSIQFLGPTGKSAEVLRSKGCLNAKTIHSFIYEAEADYEKGEMLYSTKDSIGGVNLIICDEASMINESLKDDLESFGVPILYLGDNFQLPPIKGSLNISEDYDYLLTEIHRQAKGNSIIDVADRIRNKKRIPFGSIGDNVTKMRLIRALSDNHIMNSDIVLCGYNDTRRRVNSKIRKILGYSEMIKVGELLVITKNHTNGLMNGDIVEVASVSDFDDVNMIQYLDVRRQADGRDFDIQLDCHGILGIDLKELYKDDRSKYLSFVFDRSRVFGDYGYALTVHKSQGSEFDNVLLLDEPVGRTPQDKMRWRYTGVTRAAKNLIIGAK